MNKIIASLALALAGATAPLPAAAADWSGLYVGGTLSGVRHDPQWYDVDYDWNGGDLNTPYTGFMYGLTAGWNHQSGRVVFGAELAADFSSLENFTRYSNDVNKTDALNGLIGLRGRVGLAFDESLLYFVGGLARADVEHTWTEDADVPDSWPTFDNGNLGWQYGFGVERRLGDSLSMKGEFVRTSIPGERSTNPNGFTMEVAEYVEALRVGVNYRF